MTPIREQEPSLLRDIGAAALMVVFIPFYVAALIIAGLVWIVFVGGAEEIRKAEEML